MFSKLIIIFILAPLINFSSVQMTNLNHGIFRVLYRMGRLAAFNTVGYTGSERKYFLINLERNKLQKQFSIYDEFFCDPKGPGRRSDIVPLSVHQLRPGDIDIIGAVGDSLTAGNGVMATNIFQLSVENKGMTSVAGGQGTWRQFLTIPNILKVFNPNLYGYSSGDTLSFLPASKFNVAETNAKSHDTPEQAITLLKRMRSDRRVDMEGHWKMIFYFIGSNDFCSEMCHLEYPSSIIEKHRRSIIKTLRILRDNFPRTMVNVIASPSLEFLLHFRGTPPICRLAHKFECFCLLSLLQKPFQKQYIRIMDIWRKVEEEVVNREEFQNKPDFTVNYQPFTDQIFIPTTHSGKTDFTYMSVDCFHISQKGYARATNALWNNMMEPFDNKTRTWKREFQEFKCPTEAQPFLTTKLNS
ncbi:phospholipase B1, membrane-associated-like [Sergentomyia squamirostris]